MSGLRTCTTDELTADELTSIRAVMDAAFDGDFSDDDWAHSLGGVHALVTDSDTVVAHACVVARTIRVGGVGPLRAGYVEAVATAPDRQGSGLGSAVMAALDDVIRDRFDVAFLSTSAQRFYERLGWRRWQGSTWVRHPDGTRERTEEEDDGIMVLIVPDAPPIDLRAAVECDARAGDHW